MKDTVLLGKGDQVSELPRQVWEEHLHPDPEHSKERLAFMTADHQRVRYFVVRELPRFGKPIQPQAVAETLDIQLERVEEILADLEQQLFFLVRDASGAVEWAFPVTTHPTGHLLEFDGGEQTYGAGAEDAIAAPFVQGRLRDQILTARITSSCAHCGEGISISLNSQGSFNVEQAAVNPLVFFPHVDWESFQEATIIDAYGRNSLFFWSEEHAREHRPELAGVNGLYLDLEQSILQTRVGQSVLFGFGNNVPGSKYHVSSVPVSSAPVSRYWV